MFDLVRIERDGQAVLAGRAGPHQRVEILLDGGVLETVETDNAGNFVAVLQVPLSGAAQNLQLRIAAPADSTTITLATGDDKSVDGSAGDPGSGDAAPLVTVRTAELGRPSDGDRGDIEAGSAGQRVGRGAVSPETNGLAAPQAPASVRHDRPAPKAIQHGGAAAPGDLRQVGAAEEVTRAGDADRPVDGARTGLARGKPGPDGAAAPPLPGSVPHPAAPDGEETAAVSGQDAGRIDPTTRTAAIRAGRRPVELDAEEVRSAADPEEPRDTTTVDHAARPGSTDNQVAGARSDPADAAQDRSSETPMSPDSSGDVARPSIPDRVAIGPAGAGVTRPGGSDAPVSAAAPKDIPRPVTSDRLAETPAADGPTRSGQAEPVTEPDEPDAVAETADITRPPVPDSLAEAPSVDGTARPGAADKPIDGARSDPEATVATAATEDAPQTPGKVTDTRFLTSAPIVILPGNAPDDAPTLLTTAGRDHKILQPSVSDINSVVLDRISYGETGDVVLTGRGRAGRAVRVYGNGLIIGTTRIASDGTWALAVDQGRGREIKLLRLDELNSKGAVTTRIEAPFSYARNAPKEVRLREVVIQKGDVLWRIAEQYYGEGLRYSVIYGANNALIRDPDLIYPGQVFSVPELVDVAPER